MRWFDFFDIVNLVLLLLLLLFILSSHRGRNLASEGAHRAWRSSRTAMEKWGCSIQSTMILGHLKMFKNLSTPLSRRLERWRTCFN